MVKKQDMPDVDLIQDDVSRIREIELELDALKEVIKNMVSKENIHMKTDMEPEAAPVNAALITFSDTYGMDRLRFFVNTLNETKLSVKRKSRAELIETVKAGTQPPMQQGGFGDWFKRDDHP